MNTSVGDGFSVFDEYRGFHTIKDTDGSTVWLSTDPTKLDAFWWDASSEDFGSKNFQKAMSDLLIPRTQGLISWHQLSRLQSNAKIDDPAIALPPDLSSKLALGVERLSKNNPQNLSGNGTAIELALVSTRGGEFCGRGSGIQGDVRQC